MKPIEEVYPPDEYDSVNIHDYNRLLESFEYEILLKVDSGNYYGDSFVIFKKEGKFGFLVFGWGSCSGCDALEACYNSYSMADELRKELAEKIHWEESATLLYEYLEKKDFEQEYYFNDEEFPSFLEEAKRILRNWIMIYVYLTQTLK